MSESVVRPSLDWVSQDIVCLFYRGKLRLRSIIVVEVGMVDTNLFSKRRLDLILGRVIGNVEKVVEVKIIGHGNRGQGQAGVVYVDVFVGYLITSISRFDSVGECSLECYGYFGRIISKRNRTTDSSQ